MPATKRKKFSRQRGSHTHGWGSKKKHRGKGNKGGAGMAGTGKRADAKKPSIWKNVDYFGKHGFKKKGLKEKIKPINIGLIEQKFGDKTEINLKDIGYSKLLGSGKATKKLKITARYASKKAIEAVKKAGGEVILEKARKEEVKEEKKKEEKKTEQAKEKNGKKSEKGSGAKPEDGKTKKIK